MISKNPQAVLHKKKRIRKRGRGGAKKDKPIVMFTQPSIYDKQ